MAPISALSTCVVCGARRVSPVDWDQRGPSWWWVRVRCGECGAFRQVVIDDAEAARFDMDLERAADELAEALEAFERECMLAEGRCWTKALQLDLVDAGDFARRCGDGP
jgi:hypothetical protein